MFNIKLISAVGDIIPLQPQIVITLTMFWKTKNIQHKWYLPSARHVLGINTSIEDKEKGALSSF